MTIAKLLKLETRISDATLIITGEGRFDRQTAAGKVPLGVAKIAQPHAIPVVALCGQREPDLGDRSVFCWYFQYSTRPTSS